MAWRRLTDTESSQEGKEASHDDNPFELCSGFSAVRQKLSGRVHESVRGSHLCGTLASKCDVVCGSFRHRLHFFDGIFLGNFTPSGSRLVVQGTLRFLNLGYILHQASGSGESGNIQNSISTSIYSPSNAMSLEPKLRIYSRK